VWELVTGTFGGRGIFNKGLQNFLRNTDVMQQAIANMVKIINREVRCCMEIQQMCCSEKQPLSCRVKSYFPNSAPTT